MQTHFETEAEMNLEMAYHQFYDHNCIYCLCPHAKIQSNVVVKIEIFKVKLCPSHRISVGCFPQELFVYLITLPLAFLE